jgi:Uma2 family endonuclease
MNTPAILPRQASSLARVYRLSVAEYHRMGEVGILGPELRTELIDGEIIEMPPIGHPYAGTVKLLANRLKELVGADAIVAVQDPVWLDDHSEPIPDIALLRPRADWYRNGHPAPEEVLLLIEVADTSLTYDREVKLPRYARAGIPEVWIVDLGGRQVLIHRCPSGHCYGEVVAPEDLTAIPVPLKTERKITMDLTALF